MICYRNYMCYHCFPVSWYFPKFQFLVVYTHQRVSQVALVIKIPPANAGDIRDTVLIPALGRSPGRGHSNPLQYSCLENTMDRGAWWATVHRIAKSQTWLKRLSTHAACTGWRLGCLGWHLLGNIWEQDPPRLPVSHDFFPDIALCSAQHKACIDLFSSQPWTSDENWLCARQVLAPANSQ